MCHKVLLRLLPILFFASLSLSMPAAFAQPAKTVAQLAMDNTQLVIRQINLLHNRLNQANYELKNLEQQDKQWAQMTVENVDKSLLDKAKLDISVAQSNLDSIEIELADSQQTVSWLAKNIQNYENQLNVLNIFGGKVARNEANNIPLLQADLKEQKRFLELEQERSRYLLDLQKVAANILQIRKDRFQHLNALFKSGRTILLQQQQLKDELAYQEQQNYWLQRLNTLYAELAKTDPATDKEKYNSLERDIFYANENANLAYLRSLIERYRDELRQMRQTLVKSSSISLLNETNEEVQALYKQLSRLDEIFKKRFEVIERQKQFFAHRKNKTPATEQYLNNLITLENQYTQSTQKLTTLNQKVGAFRTQLIQELQTELASRQGMPSFSEKAWLELGKEILLFPALTFQVLKGVVNIYSLSLQSVGMMQWAILAVLECILFFLFFVCRRFLKNFLTQFSQAHPASFRRIGLEWLYRNFIDLFIIGDLIALLSLLALPFKSYSVLVYLSLVWLFFKGTLNLARLSLLETAHQMMGADVQLYKRLRWTLLVGGIITALTICVHHLPFIYELKALFDRLFLLFLLFVSALLMRSWEVVPNFILSHMESHHPYFRRSIRLLGFLVPFLLFANALVGLCGFVNLIFTVSKYESYFLVVFAAYLMLRGLLREGTEQLYKALIAYTENGWLWTEAFLKPLDKILRVLLFLLAWAILFLLYGWDPQSPIVVRLSGLLHYQLLTVLDTTITPLNILELAIVISIFWWITRWTREFVYRFLLNRTKDMGIRNSIAALSQYSVILLGGFICLRVLGIDFKALAYAAGILALGLGWGLRDIVSNFASGFLILLERPLRVGDIVSISDTEGEVIHIGSRAIIVRTWDHMELVVPNTEVFNKSFTNWTAMDNIVRSVVNIKISRYDNPHEVQNLIRNQVIAHKDILKDPEPEVFLKEISENVMDFELRYFVNIRQIQSRLAVKSSLLLSIWDTFAAHGIKPPHPQHEVFLHKIFPSPPHSGGEG